MKKFLAVLCLVVVLAAVVGPVMQAPVRANVTYVADCCENAGNTWAPWQQRACCWLIEVVDTWWK